MLTDLLLCVSLSVIAFVAGYVYRSVILMKDLVRVSKELDNKLTDKIKSLNHSSDTVTVRDIKKLKHEIINDVHYFFVENDNQFVCQGTTLGEAAKNYTMAAGIDTLGVFNHLEQNKEYCFVNNECLEFINE